MRGQDVAEVAELWQKLSAGDSPLAALAPAAWAPLYGMLTDRFGITWVVDVG